MKEVLERTMGVVQEMTSRGIEEVTLEVFDIDPLGLAYVANGYADRRLADRFEASPGDLVVIDADALQEELASLFALAFSAGVSAGREDARRGPQPPSLT